MHIKCLVSCLLLLSLYTTAESQIISKAVFRVSDTEIKYAEITEGSIIFNLDNKGNIVSFNLIAGGDYDYFESGYGSRDGKIKSIGNTKIDYWINDQEGSRDGKLKSIGTMKIDYWTSDLLSGKQGKVKSIGAINIDYWNHNLLNGGQGKVKSIGNINIDYWTGDLLSGKQGKVKSIGNINIDYWTDDLLNNNHGKIKSITGNSQVIFAIKD